MRLLYVADGRSPITLNWLQGMIERGHEVHLATTFASNPGLKLASLTTIPVAFSGLQSAPPYAPAKPSSGGIGSLLRGARGIRLRAHLRHWAGPLTIPRAAVELRTLIERLQPDLVHALRIPFEGMLAAAADPSVPLIVSVWGNDFTLHAPAAPGMRRRTQRTLQRAQGLHTDCRRDLRLARRWGWAGAGPEIVLPGNGGVRTSIFYPGPPAPRSESIAARTLATIPAQSPVVINPRGFRAYVHNQTFFQAIPGVLQSHPDAIFLCPAMAGEARAEGWLERLKIHKALRLLPKLHPEEMAALYRRALVSVSPSSHDGTPNTLLEALACGCFPIAGDLESIREWIEPGRNGLLIDPRDPKALADAIRRAFDDHALHRTAVLQNLELIRARAAQGSVIQQIEAFYRSLAST